MLKLLDFDLTDFLSVLIDFPVPILVVSELLSGLLSVVVQH